MSVSAPENVTAYDFRRPRQLADDIEDLLDAWKVSFAELVTSGWNANLNIPLQWNAGDLETTRAADVTEGLGASPVIFEVTIGGENEISWFVIPKRLALAFVLAMLGERSNALPEERELTDIERSLLEMVGQEICAALVEAQPSAERLPCVHAAMARADNLGRTFTANEQIVMTKFRLASVDTESDDEPSTDDESTQSTILWLLSNRAVMGFVAHFTELKNRQTCESADLKRLVEEIPIEVVIKLGEASVHFADLAKMRVGDLLILDQRVTEPLSATVSETVKFRGWPGRVGTRQGFQITQLLTLDKN